jgi:hypothetical protein
MLKMRDHIKCLLHHRLRISHPNLLLPREEAIGNMPVSRTSELRLVVVEVSSVG